MSDADLRLLERRAATGEPEAHVAYRRMLMRLGRAKEAGLEVGDLTSFRGHMLKILERSTTRWRRPGRRVHLTCLTHGAGAQTCTWTAGGDWVNLDSKRVGVLVEPADPPGERLPVGEAAKPPAWRDMTAFEGRAALCLGRCAFDPATSAKRFARTLSAQVVCSCSTCACEVYPFRPGEPCERTRFACTCSESPCEHNRCPGIMTMGGMVTDKQAAYMWRLLWTYRRSVTDGEILRQAEARRGG